MSTIYEQQSIADRLIVELATDYALLVEAAMEAISTRRNLQVVDLITQKSSQGRDWVILYPFTGHRLD
jgi:hypothetical protein